MIIIRLKPSNREEFLNAATHMGGFIYALSKIGLLPEINQLVLSDNKLYFYEDIDR